MRTDPGALPGPSGPLAGAAARRGDQGRKAPGRVHSEQIDEKLHPTLESQAEFARANIPLGYFGDAADVAGLIAFLCSARGRYITGERIHVDGGIHHAV